MFVRYETNRWYRSNSSSPRESFYNASSRLSSETVSSFCTLSTSICDVSPGPKSKVRPDRVNGSRHFILSTKQFSHSQNPFVKPRQTRTTGELEEEEEEEEEDNEEGSSGCLHGLVGKVEKGGGINAKKKQNGENGEGEKKVRREGGKKRERGEKSRENKTELRPSCGG